MKWIYVVQDDGKDGAFLGSFDSEDKAYEYAEYIGPAIVHKVPYFGDWFVGFPTFQPKERE